MPPRFARPLTAVLAADPGLQPVLARTKEMSALAGLVVRFLPPALASQVVSCHRKGDKVVVFAATPAAAAKVKLTSESLCKFLLQNGLEVNSVSAKVQPAPPERGIAAPQKRAALSPASVSSLQDLYRKLPESPARRALKALLDHQLGAGKKSGT